MILAVVVKVHEGSKADKIANITEELVLFFLRWFQRHH